MVKDEQRREITLEAKAQAAEEMPLRQLTVGRVKRKRVKEAAPGAAGGGGADSPKASRVWQSQRNKKVRALIRSALLWVGVPVLVAGTYFGLIAADQFASRATFAIRSQNPIASQANPISVSLTGLNTNADMFIVKEYIQSRQILEDLRPAVDVRRIYSNPKGDWFARLNPLVSDEQLLEYWRGMVTVHYDLASGLSTLQVRTFDARDSKEIADHILRLSEQLVNRLSERSRSDALRLSEQTVEKAYARVMKSIDALQIYAQENKQVDPSMAVKTKSEIQGRLEGELIQYQSQLEVLRKNLPPGAPGITRLTDLIDVVEKKLAEEKARATASSEEGSSAAEVMSGFAKLNLERQFAEQAYQASLSSLETARLETMRQGQYVESFVRPQLATYAEFPERLKNVLLTFAAAAVLWAIGSLLVAATLEHF